MTDPAGERTAAERDQHDIQAHGRIDELEADCRRTFAGGDIEAVFDQVATVGIGVSPSENSGQFDVVAFEMDRRAQTPHSFDLQRAG
jgi:hypothetical protein